MASVAYRAKGEERYQATVNKVSKLSDVTERAFFHHFDSKETLVAELMQMLLTRLDKQFDRLMTEEENSDGCFTRAYIRAAFSEGAAERETACLSRRLDFANGHLFRSWALFSFVE